MVAEKVSNKPENEALKLILGHLARIFHPVADSGAKPAVLGGNGTIRVDKAPISVEQAHVPLTPLLINVPGQHS